MTSSEQPPSDKQGKGTAIHAVSRAWKWAVAILGFASALVAFWTWIKIGENRDFLTECVIFGAPFLVAIIFFWTKLESTKLVGDQAKKLEQWSLAAIVLIANVQVYWLLAYAYEVQWPIAMV